MKSKKVIKKKRPIIDKPMIKAKVLSKKLKPKGKGK
jgi:hypothetical protein